MAHPIVDLVVGARPNFIKLSPVLRALTAANRVRPRVIHTGQHYDPEMNDVFFAELGIPDPDVHLEVGSGTHGAQTGRILERYEAHLMAAPPAATVVFGDVNSTIACALAAVKLGVPVVHVEAGLRCFDRSLPEEVNRILTDAIATLLLVSEPSGVENLRREGVAENQIRLVGNVMIDTLCAELPRARELDVPKRYGLSDSGFGLITLHRPSNVDDPAVLRGLLSTFSTLGARLPLVFPVHPRTRAAARRAGLDALLDAGTTVRCVEPLGYRETLSLVSAARMVLTDSGGLQEETTFLRVPCLTLRPNTERPITTLLGTSRLLGHDSTEIVAAFDDALAGNWPAGQPVPLWDGRAAERAAQCIADRIGG